MSNSFLQAEKNEDYADLQIPHKKDVYIMQAFVDNGYKKCRSKIAQFRPKYLFNPSL